MFLLLAHVTISLEEVQTISMKIKKKKIKKICTKAKSLHLHNIININISKPTKISTRKHKMNEINHETLISQRNKKEDSNMQ